ncbi:MAG: hypothetical protein XD93_0688 [candidate division WS6 bacterium 34_10]|uniref:Cohesin domain-containing protein n=1 Tax=candidate division WS6 bacterium 34_10 TaxID=1641389 RepID=A0A117M012_9BACT|nr:MAG: hypothetical protein XD93_0688 [candidate division WS6 bacterium 34_10]
MNIYRKYLYLLVGLFMFVALSKSTAYASADIILDYDKAGAISVIINSGEESIPGVDMRILYSSDLTIESIESAENYCDLGFNNEIEENSITLECFNDVDTKMNGAFATITYSAQSDNYYLYIDQNSLDIGDVTIGMVSDMNKPEADPEFISQDKNIAIQIVDFIKDYNIYIIAVTILLTLIGVLVALLKRKKGPSTNKEVDIIENQEQSS